jgi:hypothetical protein
MNQHEEVPPRTRPWPPKRLYKYGTPEHVEVLVNDGVVHIGTLGLYAEIEDVARQDKDEGIVRAVGTIDHLETSGDPAKDADANQALRRLGFDDAPRGSITIKGMRFDAQYHSEPLYIYCLSERYGPDLLAKWGRACVVIDNPLAFIVSVTEALGADQTGWQCDPIRYLPSRTFHPLGMPQGHSAWIKEERFSDEQEVRMVWNPANLPLKEDHRDVVCKGATLVCRRYTGIEPLNDNIGHVFHDRTLEDMSVFLDGSEFKNCSFQRCRLITIGGSSHIENCSTSACQLKPYGAAQNTANVLRSLIDSDPGGRSWLENLLPPPPPTP